MGNVKTKVATEEFYGIKKPTKIWDVDVDNTVISKLIKKNIYSKYLTGYLDDVIRPFVLILLKISGCVRTFEE